MLTGTVLRCLHFCWDTPRLGKAAAEKPSWSQQRSGYIASDDRKIDKGASLPFNSPPPSSPLSFSYHLPVPIMSLHTVKYTQHSHGIFISLSRYHCHSVNWAYTNHTQVSPCGVPLCFPDLFASPDHYGRLINKNKLSCSKKSESQDTSTKYVTQWDYF